MKWAMFCTYDAPAYFLIGIYDNEIDAVIEFKDHVRSFSLDHVPHIYFAPVPAGFDAYRSEIFYAPFLEDCGFDLSINYFREPVTTN